MANPDGPGPLSMGDMDVTNRKPTRRGTAQAVEGMPAQVEEVKATEAPVKLCECGCGTVVSPKARFKPGHDARYKGALLKQFDAGNEAAGATLVKNGWKSQAELDERTAKATERAEAKARREADREARATTAKAAKPAVAQEAA